MKISDHFLLLLMLFFFIAGIGTFADYLKRSNEPIVSYIEDKTAESAEGPITMTPKWKTGKDIITAISILDEYTPYPAAIRINNNPVIRFTSDFVSYKWDYISMYYTGGGQNLQAFEDWTVVDSYFVEGTTVAGVYVPPYIQLRLEE